MTEKEIITASTLFDRDWYIREYPDVLQTGLDPADHYLQVGALLRRDPGPSFNTQFYLNTNEDVASSGMNPLVHYLLYGAEEGRAPLPTTEKLTPVSAPAAAPAAAPVQSGHRSSESPEECWLRFNLDTRRLSDQVSKENEKYKKHSFSIVVPVYNPPIGVLKDCVFSLINQSYDNYDIVLVDDCSTCSEVRGFLEQVATHPRINVIFRSENGHISIATNDGAMRSRADYLVFVDNDDLLEAHALATCNLYINRSNPDIIFTDEMKTDESGSERFGVKFKPGYSPEMLLSYCYFSHLVVMRTSLFRDLGGFRRGYEGSQDHDLWLRATEVTDRITHIPQKLYVRRVLPGSTAASGDEKNYAYDAGHRAVSDAFRRRGANASVIRPDWAVAGGYGLYIPQFPHDGPSVRIIVVTTLDPLIVSPLLESLSKTAYKNFSVTLYCNGIEERLFLQRKEIAQKSIGGAFKCDFVFTDTIGKPFNYSKLNNQAAIGCREEFLLFLNDDIECDRPAWLSQMIGWAQLPGVGIVGLKLLYPKRERVQHGGVAHGLHLGTVGTLYKHTPARDRGHLFQAAVTRNVSAVTGACLLIKNSAFESIGGFDEVGFPVTYSDVDLCYRVTAATGLRIVQCNETSAVHHESFTRSKVRDPFAISLYKKKYGRMVDLFVNPCTNLERHDLSPHNLIIPEGEGSLKIILFSHNLNYEGAPLSLFYLALYLSKQENTEVSVWSPAGGPVEELYSKSGIRVIIGLNGKPIKGFLAGIQNKGHPKELFHQIFSSVLQETDCNLVLANTVLNYWVIQAAAERNVPSIWTIRESEGIDKFFQNEETREEVRESFSVAYQVVYVAEETRRVYKRDISHHNSTVIPNGLYDPGRFVADDENERDLHRKRLGLDQEDFCILQVGTICERKNQKDIVDAFVLASNAFRDKKMRLILVGHRPGNVYGDDLVSYVSGLDNFIRERITILPEDGKVEGYYKAADIFCFTSTMESYPRVIIEAMAAGLPIISTKVMGTASQIIPGVGGEFYKAGNTYELALKIVSYENDRDKLNAAARGSRATFESLTSYEEMGEAYVRLCRSALLYSPWGVML